MDCGGGAEVAEGRRGVCGVFSFMLTDQTDPAAEGGRGVVLKSRLARNCANTIAACASQAPNRASCGTMAMAQEVWMVNGTVRPRC